MSEGPPVSDYTRRSTWLGLLIFLMDYVILGTLIAGALWLPSWWAKTVCSLLAGIAIGVLFVVGHDAGHNSLTPHRWLNKLLGHLALLPALHPYSLWVLVHNLTHHRWTNLSPQDYVWTPLSLDEYRQRSWFGRQIYRLYRGPLGQLVYYFFEFWLRRMIFPSRQQVRGTYKREYVLDLALVIVAAASYLSLLIVGAQRGVFGPSMTVAWTLLFGCVLPFAVWNALMSTVIYLHHTHPGLRWDADEAVWQAAVDQLETAVHVIFPGPINLLFHWIMEHNAHHARPSIPLYHLPAAQRAYEEEAAGRIIVLKWTPLAHWDILTRCKLYDFERHCWLNFAGQDTSPRNDRATRRITRRPRSLDRAKKPRTTGGPPAEPPRDRMAANDLPESRETRG